jgi:hypothetical protein
MSSLPCMQHSHTQILNLVIQVSRETPLPIAGRNSVSMVAARMLTNADPVILAGGAAV